MKRKEFELCKGKNELIETGDKDWAMASELLNLAIHRLNFWQEIKLEEKYPTLYIEGHYEIIKELCTAILALDGWKAINHECLFAYLKEKKKDLEIDIDYLLDLKDTRNSIDYYGTKLKAQLWKENKLKIRITIHALEEYVKKQLQK